MKSKTAFSKGKLKRGISGMEPWNQVVEKALADEVFVSRNRIFASNASLCERQTAGYTKLEDHAIKRKASSEFYFATGSLFEELMERAFKKAGVWITSELRVQSQHSEVEVSGRIDFVLKDLETGDPIIMELKSTGKLPSSPKPHHLAQIHTYLLLTGQTKGLLWYISRYVSDYSGDLKQKVFEVELSDEEKRAVALKLALGAVYIDSPFLPEKPDEMKKWKCGFCPLIPFCWDDVPAESIGLSFEEPDFEDQEMLLKQAETIADDLIEMQSDLKLYFKQRIKTATS